MFSWHLTCRSNDLWVFPSNFHPFPIQLLINFSSKMIILCGKLNSDFLIYHFVNTSATKTPICMKFLTLGSYNSNELPQNISCQSKLPLRRYPQNDNWESYHSKSGKQGCIKLQQIVDGKTNDKDNFTKNWVQIS